MTKLLSRIALGSGLCFALVVVWLRINSMAGIASDGCPLTSRVLAWSIDRIRANSVAKIRNLSCREIHAIEAVNQDLLEITTGRLSGRPVICLSFNRSQPCQYILADLPQDEDPTSVLAEIFGYRQNLDTLNETVERLFIRPARYIK